MKILPGIEEKRWALDGKLPFSVLHKEPQDPKSLILLLHGLNERGRRVYRRLSPYLPADALILAPNGPFPLPRMKSDRLDFGYAWYFYDRFTKTYHTDQSFAVDLLKQLLYQVNSKGLPVTIIGFSQGGYLAPLLAYEDLLVKKVIGLGCEFRNHFFPKKPHFKMIAVHGEKDAIIPPEHALREIEILKEKDIDVDWHLVPETAHEISTNMGNIIKELLQ